MAFLRTEEQVWEDSGDTFTAVWSPSSDFPSDTPVQICVTAAETSLAPHFTSAKKKNRLIWNLRSAYFAISTISRTKKKYNGEEYEYSQVLDLDSALGIFNDPSDAADELAPRVKELLKQWNKKNENREGTAAGGEFLYTCGRHAWKERGFPEKSRLVFSLSSFAATSNANASKKLGKRKLTEEDVTVAVKIASSKNNPIRQHLQKTQNKSEPLRDSDLKFDGNGLYMKYPAFDRLMRTREMSDAVAFAKNLRTKIAARQTKELTCEDEEGWEQMEAAAYKAAESEVESAITTENGAFETDEDEFAEKPVKMETEAGAPQSQAVEE